MKFKFFKANREDKRGIILFIHGFATTSSYFDNVGTELSNNYDYYAIELEGMGISALNDKRQIVTPSYYAHQIINFIIQKGLTKLILVGHGMGGGIANIIGYLAPELIEKVICICPMNTGFHVSLINGLFLRPTNKLIGWYSTKLIYKYPLKIYPLKMKDQNFINYLKLQKNIRTHTLKLLISIGLKKHFDILINAEKNLNLPIHLIVAKNDKIINYKTAIRKLSTNPNVKYYVINNSGHCPFIDQYDEFMTILTKVIKL